MKLIAVLVLSLAVAGCNNLKPNNLIDTAATSTVGYLVGGPVVGLAVAATTITVKEVLPEADTIKEVKNTKQLIAYSYDKTLEYALYAAIAFFVFTGVISPYFIQRRMIRKKKYNL